MNTFQGVDLSSFAVKGNDPSAAHALLDHTLEHKESDVSKAQHLAHGLASRLLRTAASGVGGVARRALTRGTGAAVEGAEEATLASRALGVAKVAGKAAGVVGVAALGYEATEDALHPERIDKQADKVSQEGVGRRVLSAVEKPVTTILATGKTAAETVKTWLGVERSKSQEVKMAADLAAKEREMTRRKTPFDDMTVLPGRSTDITPSADLERTKTESRSL